MLPNIDPRQMKRVMKQMGIKQEEIDANQVVIKCNDRDIVIDNPEVMKIDMRGEISFQISGSVHEQSIESEPEINDDDVQTVVDATEVDFDTAKEKLIENKGDIAKTIMDLKK